MKQKQTNQMMTGQRQTGWRQRKQSQADLRQTGRKKMERVQADRKQQALLDRFFLEEKVWYPDYYAFYVVTVICLAIAMMLFIVPYQVWENDYQVLAYGLFLEAMGGEMYSRRYSQYREGGRTKSIREVLQYLPVSGAQTALYVFRKLMKLYLRLTAGAAACQILFSLIFLHRVSLANVLMPVVCCLILPALLSGATVWHRVQP